jgi:hypothetical protein
MDLVPCSSLSELRTDQETNYPHVVIYHEKQDRDGSMLCECFRIQSSFVTAKQSNIFRCPTLHVSQGISRDLEIPLTN